MTLEPKFEMRRPVWSTERRALDSGKTVRDRSCGLIAVYTPVRVKPRYWTSATLSGSVIHIATGRGVLTQGTVATRGWITVEPYCNASLTWPRSLSSPADFPERRLCGMCLERVHGATPSNLVQSASPRAITVHVTTA